MEWKTMYMPLLHKSNRQLFGYFFHMRQPGRVGQSVSRLIQEQEIPVQYPDRPNKSLREVCSTTVWQYNSMAVQQRGNTAG